MPTSTSAVWGPRKLQWHSAEDDDRLYQECQLSSFNVVPWVTVRGLDLLALGLGARFQACLLEWRICFRIPFLFLFLEWQVLW